jgi:hypothetical protein
MCGIGRGIQYVERRTTEKEVGLLRARLEMEERHRRERKVLENQHKVERDQLMRKFEQEEIKNVVKMSPVIPDRTPSKRKRTDELNIRDLAGPINAPQRNWYEDERRGTVEDVDRNDRRDRGIDDGLHDRRIKDTDMVKKIDGGRYDRYDRKTKDTDHDDEHKADRYDRRNRGTEQAHGCNRKENRVDDMKINRKRVLTEDRHEDPHHKPMEYVDDNKMRRGREEEKKNRNEDTTKDENRSFEEWTEETLEFDEFTGIQTRRDKKWHSSNVNPQGYIEHTSDSNYARILLIGHSFITHLQKSLRMQKRKIDPWGVALNMDTDIFDIYINGKSGAQVDELELDGEFYESIVDIRPTLLIVDLGTVDLFNKKDPHDVADDIFTNTMKFLRLVPELKSIVLCQALYRLSIDNRVMQLDEFNKRIDSFNDWITIKVQQHQKLHHYKHSGLYEPTWEEMVDGLHPGDLMDKDFDPRSPGMWKYQKSIRKLIVYSCKQMGVTEK